MKEKTQRWLKRLALVVVGLGLVYGLALGLSHIRLSQAYRALKKDGRQMTLAAMIPPAIPDHDNAALLYNSAILRLKAEPVEMQSLMDHLRELLRDVNSKDPSPNAKAELEDWVASRLLTDVFDLVSQGTHRPGCRFDLNYEDGVNIQESHLGDLRLLTLLMRINVQRLIADSHYQEAWQQVETLTRFSDALQYEPLLVNQLVRMAQMELSIETLHDLCGASTPTIDQIGRFKNLFTSFETQSTLTQALDGERLIFGEWLFHSSASDLGTRLQQIGVNSNTIMLTTYARLGKPLFLADHTHYLHIMHQTANSAEKPFFTLSESALNVTEDQPRRYLLCNILTPAFFRLKERQASLIAHLRIAQIGLGLIEHYQEYLAYPDTLNSWPQEITLDPFTGAPLTYRPDPNGFLLYSVGRDTQDNQGRPRQRGQEEWDIPWLYRRAE